MKKENKKFERERETLSSQNIYFSQDAFHYNYYYQSIHISLLNFFAKLIQKTLLFLI